MQKSIATFWPSFPPQRMRRPVIFWNHLPFNTYLTALQSGKTIAMKERLPCPWPVSKLTWPSVSPPSLFSKSSPSNVLQTDVECRSDVAKWLSLGYSWPSVSTCGSRMVAFKLQNLLTRIDLGKMIIDPRPSFQTVWLNQKCWYLKNAQKDVECRSTFVQRPHHDLVPFSALQNNDLFLWSVGINSYHNNAHISKLSGF